ncbi:DUF6083 domain-containing protein [Streptomyces sp. NPDC007905]|uniref:DUF6083 domain-containing protein n=1 Tax=Streptomyces sp. NPDC007905 TaxID=3364788 RepID=UPI0036EBBA70
MHPTPSSTGRYWDGSPRSSRHPRPLRVAPTSPSRLLRAGHSSRCHRCGHRIDLYQRADHRTVALHPGELAVTHIPETCRWHLSGGIAYPHGDGSAWCRIPHAVLCPAQPPVCPLSASLAAARRQLAVRTRRLIDTKAFTPAPDPAASPSPHTPAQPSHPIVQILLVRYLTPSPLNAIQCVAQTRQRHRCPQPVLTPQQPAGHWRLMPTGPCHGQLALPDTPMAVYDLSHLPYTEQLRWRAQHCPAHATPRGAPDLTLADWQAFDPLLHAAHISTRLPHPPAPQRQRH